MEDVKTQQPNEGEARATDTQGIVDIHGGDDSQEQAEKAAVKRWISRYNAAETKWEKDFTRMKNDMEFATGIQWDCQQNMVDNEGRYVANLTLRAMQQKVAQLYAKNPTVEAVMRKRLNYMLWDGSVEMLQQAMMGVMMSQQVGVPDMMSEAVMQDFMRGKQEEQVLKRVCKTMEILDQYEIDTCKPDFKESMKQLVRRVVTCGVGYVRISFVRDGAPMLSSSEVPHSIADRIKAARQIIEKIDEDKVRPEDAEMETLRSLMLSIGASQQTQDDYEMEERIEHDFLPALNVVPDERCRALKDFVAGRWLFIKYTLPIEEINTMFNLVDEDDRVKSGTNQMSEENANPGKQLSPEAIDATDPAKAGKALLLEILDYQTKTRCFIVKGHKKYVQKPEPLSPCVSGFWPVFALTFNDVEASEDTKASIFPPSDVFLMRDAQMEWNRTRDALRAQRNANAPTYLVRKGLLTDEDKENLKNREPNEVLELEGVPVDKEPSTMIGVLQTAAIDNNVYDTGPLEQDMLLVTGMQQANVGPAEPDVTATVGTIAEQSRNIGVSSNVDDLDGFLSRLARARGEMRLQAMNPQTVIRIVGPGASWPTLNKSEFLNQIELTIKAGSSGRPNQALQVRNRQIITPMLQQSGANPIAIIEDLITVMGDDSLDAQKFFPIPGQFTPAAPMGQGGQPGQQQSPPQAQQQVGPPPGQLGPQTQASPPLVAA